MTTHRADYRAPEASKRGALRTAAVPLLPALLLAAPAALAFDSGSTGADGAFAPTVSTRLQLPEDGVFNFTTVNIPAGVNLDFNKNTTNTPVVILASGDVAIHGQIRVNGGWSPAVGTAGAGNVADDGLAGQGGPGGYAGGTGGGPSGDHLGGDGHGPGAGKRGLPYSSYRTNGGSGSYGTVGYLQSSSYTNYSGVRGPTYGSSLLLPLIGGSGGGGAMGGNTFSGSGGAGGGGAILIASSGTVHIGGGVRADGGRSGDSAGSGCGAVGGNGSGGGIRIVATTLTGAGTLSVAPGYRFNAACSSNSGYSVRATTTYMADGGLGRIRLEAETNHFTSTTTPTYSFGLPGDLFIAGLPTLRISRVDGVDAPASPTGTADISLPTDIVNPVTVEFEATGIPLGNIVKLTVTPRRGAIVSALSNALDGDSNLSTASALVSLPQGPSTLLASVTYTLVASAGHGFEHYAGGETVEAIRVEAGLDGTSRYVLITASGKEIPVARARLAAG